MAIVNVWSLSVQMEYNWRTERENLSSQDLDKMGGNIATRGETYFGTVKSGPRLLIGTATVTGCPLYLSFYRSPMEINLQHLESFFLSFFCIYSSPYLYINL